MPAKTACRFRWHMIPKHYKKHSPEIIVFEATGKYELSLRIALAQAALPCCAMNPARIRDFAGSYGILVKTDKIDAKIIARFATERNPTLQEMPTETQLELKKLLAYRRQLVQERVRCQNQREHAFSKLVIKDTEKAIEQIKERIKKVEEKINDLIQSEEQMKQKTETLKSIPGIGVEVARTLAVECPEMGEGNANTLCALIGLTPINWDSGKMRGKRHIHGGRATVRNALYMSATRTKTDNVFKRIYQHLIEKKLPQSPSLPLLIKS
ncbi:MAG: IS110 family transposase [Planctomycetaceae bacterium]|nr:IS110 family transposase [Planctomycetaceae bacterium]